MSRKIDLNNGRAVYGRLLSYTKPYRWGFFFAVIGMIIVAVTEVAFAWIMDPLLDGTFVKRDEFYITMVPLALLAIFVTRGFGSFGSVFFMTWVGRHVVKDLRREMFDHLLTLPTSYYDKNPSGKMISRLIYDVEQVSEASSRAVTVLIQDTLTIIGLFGFMFYTNWRLTLLFLTIAPVMTAVVVYVNKRQRKISTRLQDSVGDITHVSQETVEGIRVVKVFGGQQYESDQYDAANKANRSQFMKITVTNAASVPVVQLMAASLLALIIFLATHPSMPKQMEAGEFMAFMTAMMLLFPPIKRLTTITMVLQKGIAASQSIFSFLQEPKELDTGTQALDRAKGDVVIDKVSFTYDEEKGRVLNQVSIEVKSGETVALVGKSGSGKTTLASLLPRFYNADEGRILIDGIDTKDICLADLRKQIALVSQDVRLFNDSIEHNIAYGKLDTATREDVINAAKAAYAWEYIEKMPQGLDTQVGEHGVLLSGGQRQRLAIARALLKNAPILILDEATSALDTESERQVQMALEQLMANRTTFVIAHRLSTIENADKIVVMHDGRVVEVGSHKELLAKGGHYAALYELQFGENETVEA
ncbi:MAG: lipid A export permease/ATP-binding protein MsbA [Gammaproteobacteria bacterium]|nr:lipid A export permease/ATP-binding protein MsbA [Gammaproteobacteria bacterium]MDH5694028.1 lipid A export permease/ATP-binding protein MsbA [Gammaproteobacteria bacterium]